MNSLMADLQIYRLIYVALRWTEVGFVYRAYVVDVLVTTIFGLLYNKRWYQYVSRTILYTTCVCKL